VLNSTLVASPNLKTRFEREAKSISQLNHANICTLYDVVDEDGGRLLKTKRGDCFEIILIKF